MSRESQSSFIVRLERVSRFASALIALAGVAVLLGWLFGSRTLTRILPGPVAMNPLTAACFVAAGCSLGAYWLAKDRPSSRNRIVARSLAAFLIATGFLILLDSIFQWNLRMDQVLFRAKLNAGISGPPNRMAPETAFDFLLVGCALLLLNSSARCGHWSQNLSLVLLFHSLMAVLGCIYGAKFFDLMGPFLPMSVHTPAMFFLLALGCLFARADFGATSLLVSRTSGGVIARHLLPWAFAVPAILGVLWMWGENHAALTSRAGMTLVVLACIAALVALTCSAAILLNHADCRHLRVKAALRKARDELESRVRERTSALLETTVALRAEIAEHRCAEDRLRQLAGERRNLDEQFLRAQRVESIGALAEGIAHDLNNALVPILMGSELLRERSQDRPDQREVLDLIAGSVRRCTEMVRQILNFARGKPPESASVPVGLLVSEMAKIAKGTFPKSITIDCQIAAELWHVAGDATELHQVLMNLCVNARDAMPEGGQLRLHAENLTLPPGAFPSHPDAAPGQYVLVIVADTGIGIAPEVRPRIFEPFFTTKTSDRGTGLGLSTVAEILKRHKGFLELHTEIGKGSEFKIHLPAAPAAPPQQPAKAAVLPGGHGELILLVDDEQVVLELARTTLENYGYRVLTAANGLEAVGIFEAHKNEIRLVLTDTDMPFMDGMNEIRAVRKISPDVPILLANATRSNTEHFLRSAVPGLMTLTKPYGVDQLVTGVAKALAASETAVTA